jgi:putative phage-type endonuclease
MIVCDLKQGSVDWLAWRAHGLGSSDVPILWNGKHFGRTAHKLWQEKVAVVHGVGREQRIPKKVPENAAMKRGRELEPIVRQWYQVWTGFSVQPVCACHDDFPWMKSSLDGWVPEHCLVLEIKCPGVRWDGSCDHDLALEGRVPDKYLPQLVDQCLVSGATQVHYLSYGDPEHYAQLDRFKLLTFRPQLETIGRLLHLKVLFWQCVLEQVDPRQFWVP